MGGLPAPCLGQTKQFGCNTCNISQTGAWAPPPGYMYFLDLGLAAGLSRFFRAKRVTEVGAGLGCYTAALRDAGISIRGYDGMPGVARRTGGLVRRADMVEDLSGRLPRSDWVLALEIAEHVPKSQEKWLLANLHAGNAEGADRPERRQARGAGEAGSPCQPGLHSHVPL